MNFLVPTLLSVNSFKKVKQLIEKELHQKETEAWDVERVFNLETPASTRNPKAANSIEESL